MPRGTPEQTINIHRFNNSVAFDLSSTETLYLSEDLARRFGKELIKHADDIKKNTFLKSTLGKIITLREKQT